MDRHVFEQLRSLIHQESGIYLADEKESLLSNRLAKRLRACGVQTEDEYLRLLGLDTSGEELIELIDAISTNVTHFFREEDHFRFFGNVLQGYREERRPMVKIWCAASSTGEEPYTLAMVADSMLRDSSTQWRILATDICTKVLQHAHEGRYGEQHVQSVPDAMKRRCFTFDKTDPSLPWLVRPELRSQVQFRKLNLAQHPFPLKPGLDIIFCRNVMIYFRTPLRQQIVDEMYRLLHPGGVLVLSHSENLLSINHSFESCGASIFRKTKAGPLRSAK